MKNLAMLVGIIFVLSSCATSPPKYSSSDIANATTREEKISLYGSLEREIAATSSKSTRASYEQLKTQLGLQLGQEEAARIRQEMRKSRLASGQVPLNILNQADADSKPIQQWNVSEFQGLVPELQKQRSVTEKALSNQESLLDSLTLDSDLVPRVECLGRISDLYGDNKTADMAYKVAFEDAQNQLTGAAEMAASSGDFSTALRKYQELQRLNPEYPGIDQLIANSRTGVESSGFRQMLIAADIEGAWAAFLDLSERPMTRNEKAEFFGPAGNLAEYFSVRASESLNSRMYLNAYIYIKREKKIRAWMDQPSQIGSKTIDGFTESMFDLADASNADDKLGLEYGYLLLVEEFNPDYATLETRKRETGELVYDNAIRRVGSVSIDSPDSSDQQIASQIAAGVRQYLMENIPEDVKIVERAKLDEVKRERSMSEDQDESGLEAVKLESADFLIEGELLKAEVATDVKRVRNRKRVVTGQEEQANPEFDAWIKAKGRKKADHPDAPPRTVMVPVKEDIELNYEEHRKVGEVGVTYWVIDTTTAEHLHSESINKSYDESDESLEGVQIGDFVQEAKLPQLPSDIEIYTLLVDEVVDTMASDLVDFLANPEGDYFVKCQQHAEEEEFSDAAEQCASAAVLKDYKSLDNQDVVSLLKTVTLSSNMRLD